MTSTASNAWMPAGRYDVNIGSSLARALKARKGGPVKNGKAKLDREFYSIRYNFKPESVDSTKPGTIEVNKPKDEGGPAQVHIVRPSTQSENGVHFIGGENSQREFDCVLIYDEELGTITLEKIDSSVTVNHDARPVHAPRHPNSPAPAPPQRITSSASNAPRERAPIAKKEEEEESEGEIPEPPKSKPASRPAAVASIVPPKLKPPTPAHQPASASQPAARPLPPSLPPKPTQATASAKPRPRPIGTSVPTPTSASTPAPASTAAPVKGANKRELPSDAAEPPQARRTMQPPLKRAKVVPEKPKEKEKKEPPPLALPGSSAVPALALPSGPSALTKVQPPALSLPSSSAAVALPSAPEPPVTTTTVTDSDEEEWDEVQPTIAAPTSAPASALPPPPPSDPLAPRTIVMEEIEPDAFTPPAGTYVDGVEEEEIDMAAFEEELKEELGDPEADAEMLEAEVEAEADGEGEEDDLDFLAGAMSPVVERQPVSLNRFLGGPAEFGDDDDYSSSEDSDDE
ncbi:hypothetical protein GY45DRAFT_1431340 [Cubamyces sp. BRFM 1775]|nr:hypothetical protein GY45DRAFT_1431340 [Cubamyces sp. BRFM 1775]